MASAPSANAPSPIAPKASDELPVTGRLPAGAFAWAALLSTSRELEGALVVGVAGVCVVGVVPHADAARAMISGTPAHRMSTEVPPSMECVHNSAASAAQIWMEYGWASEHGESLPAIAADSETKILFSACRREAFDETWVRPFGPRGYPQLGLSFQTVTVVVPLAAPDAFSAPAPPAMSTAPAPTAPPRARNVRRFTCC